MSVDSLPSLAVAHLLRRLIEGPAESSRCTHFEASKVEVRAKSGI